LLLYPKSTISLSSYKETSLQGDSALVEIYKQMGVDTHFQNKMTLVKQSDFKPENLNLDLNNTPDIAQTMVVTCIGFGCHLTGLHTLKSKKR
jgi:3-phosphoshikimate 1-carboxyvinyltransferase